MCDSGDDKRKINVAAFEALIYSAAQASEAEANSSGIPISFAFGWVDNEMYLNTRLIKDFVSIIQCQLQVLIWCMN